MIPYIFMFLFGVFIGAMIMAALVCLKINSEERESVEIERSEAGAYDGMKL